MNFLFKEFNATNLNDDIKEVVDLNDEEVPLEVQLKKYLLPRLNIFCNDETIYYIFENEYIETEWKDMISVHYINTSYQTRRTVMRVHLFRKPELEEKVYLGFITLRSINDVELMLSYIYPNWKNMLKNLKENCYFITYKKRVHICGRELNIYTYPLYVQDSAVTSCSHASMISMSKYLEGKYNYNNIRIFDINNSYTYGRKKIYPTLGLDPLQMLEILDTNGISVDYKLYSDKMQRAVRAHIDFCIESAMPVLLGIHIVGKEGVAEHVVQIIGHTIRSDGERDYIIYDDSGYFIAQKNHDDNPVAPFIDIVTWDEIKDLLKEGEEHECGFIMYPMHEKIYILYDELIKRHFDPLMKRINKVKGNVMNVRVLIVDNNLVKKYLNDLLLKDQSYDGSTEDEKYEADMELEIERLLKQNLPHYVWVFEVSLENGKKNLILADPTLNSATRKSILLSSETFTVTEGFALLNDFS